MILLLILGLLITNLGVILISATYTQRVTNSLVRQFTLNTALVIFVLSLLLWFKFDSGVNTYQLIYSGVGWSALNISFNLGLDGYSLPFCLLTTFIMPFCLLTDWENKENFHLHIFCLLLIEFFLIISFTAIDLFLFFLAFESTLVPMFLLIGKWGHYTRKIKAALFFFLFTFTSSLSLLFGLLLLYTNYGTINLYILLTTPAPLLFQHQVVVWCLFFLPFAVKAPLFPFHIWLPEAHVEAPTSGSMVLAALLLKLSIYGIVRLVMPLCPDANLFFLPATCTLLLVGFIYTSLTTIRQTDLKRIIAYSSVTHMTYAIIGVFVGNYYSITGSIVLAIAHGFTSAGLFFLIGTIYQRGHRAAFADFDCAPHI